MKQQGWIVRYFFHTMGGDKVCCDGPPIGRQIAVNEVDRLNMYIKYKCTDVFRVERYQVHRLPEPPVRRVVFPSQMINRR